MSSIRISDPENCYCNEPHRPVASGTFVVADGNATKLLAAIDEALDSIALSVNRAVKGDDCAVILAHRSCFPGQQMGLNTLPLVVAQLVPCQLLSPSYRKKTLFEAKSYVTPLLLKTRPG